ncbi:MAG: DNA polymerase domain-containing protein [Candidatus Thorarchaeota archaeon]
MEIMYIDIEAEDLNVENPGHILSISFLFKDTYYTLLHRPGKKSNINYDRFLSPVDGEIYKHMVYYCQSEEYMLGVFIAMLNELDPDILTGWNSNNYDFPYMFNRMRRLGIDYTRMSPIGTTDYKGYPKGRYWFDLYQGYVKIYGRHRSDALGPTVKRELGIDIYKRPEEIITWYNKGNYKKLITYNTVDVDVLKHLDKKKNITKYFITLARTSGVDLNDVFMNTRILDMTYLMNKPADIVLPTKKYEREYVFEKVKGANVIEPTPGLYKNVSVLDMSRLYPSILLTFNISYETVNKDGEGIPIKAEIKTKDGVKSEVVYFRQDKDGISKRVVRKLFKVRDDIEQEMKKYKRGSDKYEELKTMVQAVKTVINTTYGYFLYRGARLHNRYCGAAITAIGRKIIQYIASLAREKGYEVITGDTDSIHIVSSIDEAKEFEKYVNEKLKDFVSVYGLKQHYLRIKFEKHYESALYMSKKKYAGKVVWEDGDYVEKPRLEIKGLELKKSDWPDITAEMQEKMLEKALLEDDLEGAYHVFAQYYKDVIEGNVPVEKVAIPARLTKDAGEYKSESAHLRAVNFSNTILHAAIGVDEKYKWVYGRLEDYPPTDVVAWNENTYIDFKKLRVDWEKMAERCIKNPGMRLLETFGFIASEEPVSNETSLEDFG